MKTQVKEILARYIDDYYSKWDFSGVVQIMYKGEIVFEKALGYTCIEFGIKNSMSTCFSLASMTKQFTAFAIMLLYDRQLLDIDKSANLYLSSDMSIDEKITVHNLLSHTSGLYNFYNFEDDFFAEYNRSDYSKEKYFIRYINRGTNQPPNEKYDYNNSNYNLLAWIIENITGMKYDEFILENVFIPLNMFNSIIDNSSCIILNKAFNYVMDYDKYIRCPFYNEKFSIGAGALVSNCEDLIKWYFCLKDRKILSNKTYDRFFSENLNHYCYGLEHNNIYSTSRFSHGGDHIGISTYMQNFFEENLCIIILSNNDCINQYKLGNAISDIIHGVPAELPAKYKEIEMDDKTLSEYEGTYLDDKIKLELINGKLYFVRYKGNLHIELYPVGKGQFTTKYRDQSKPYVIERNVNGELEFFGYKKHNR